MRTPFPQQSAVLVKLILISSQKVFCLVFAIVDRYILVVGVYRSALGVKTNKRGKNLCSSRLGKGRRMCEKV